MSMFDRLRDASFVDANGVEHFFNVDSLERSTTKKGSTQEVLDSNESITQDQGNSVWTFTIDAYFTGQDYDIATDAFVKGLSLKYSQDTPGLLKHPRWGNINVFPMSISQKEELIKGIFVGRVTVPFVEVFPKIYPTSDGQSLIDALLNLDDMEEKSQEIAGGINTDQAQEQTNVLQKLNKSRGTITKFVSDGSDTFNSIGQSISNTVDVLGDAVDIIASVQRLIRTPARIKEQTLTRINGYLSMIDQLCTDFYDKNETRTSNQKNNTIMMELVAGLGVGALCEQASFTDYQTRSEAITAIEKINEGFSTFDTAFNNVRTTGLVSDDYSGDHNFWSLLLDTIKKINQLLLETAFDLKTEKKIVLTNNSDIISLCYEYYEAVDNETSTPIVKYNVMLQFSHTRSD